MQNRLTRPLVKINYRNARILAPMVRINTLPFRLTSKRCGADIVYSEELVDKKLLQCQRTINEEFGIVEYKLPNNPRVVYSTSPELEDKPLVLQIGTAEAQLALQVAQKLYHDYDAIDINCGCPKHFSISGGMGAKLLQDKDRLVDILSTLVKNVPDKSITCKIRLLDRLEDTIDLVKRIEQTGVQAIAVHARYVPQRPREKAHLTLLQEVVKSVSIPVIANGDFFTNEDVLNAKEITGCDSVMIARGALWNCAIFSRDSQFQSEWDSPHYRALQVVNTFQHFRYPFPNAKFVIQSMYGSQVGQFSTLLSHTKTFEELSHLIASALHQPVENY